MSGATYFGASVAIRAYAITNQLDQMDAQIGILEKISPRLWSLQEHGIAAALWGDFEGAEKRFIELGAMGDADSASRATLLRAVLAADRGNFAGAANLLEDGDPS
jgi:hypothetical protein